MAYDATKPVTGGSLVAADIRENFRAILEDGIVVASDASISQAKLKTTTGSLSTTDTTGLELTLPGGEYGFYPQIKASDPNTGGKVYIYTGLTGLTTTYVTHIFIKSPNAAVTFYAQQRYVTASGEVFWIFILRDKITKRIISMYQAPDHPCFGNGGKPLLVSHPFLGYDPVTEEIVVINPSSNEVLEIKEKCIMGEDEPDKDFLEVFEKEYEIDESSSPLWPTKEVTVGLPSDKDWKIMPPGALIKPIKKVITKPDYIIVKSLKKK